VASIPSSTLRMETQALQPSLYLLRNLTSFRFDLELGSISPTCLCTAFTHKDPKSIKRQSSHQYLFTLLVSAQVKALRKTLMKLTPEVIFINILGSAFYAKVFFKAFFYFQFGFVIFCWKNIGVKSAGKMLVKLTSEVTIKVWAGARYNTQNDRWAICLKFAYVLMLTIQVTKHVRTWECDCEDERGVP